MRKLSKVKSKAVPLRHAGAKGRGNFSFYLLLTSVGSEWSASRPGRAFPTGKGSSVPIGWEAAWASELFWTQRLEEKFFASAGDRMPVV
jgi:hypothetical protein